MSLPIALILMDAEEKFYAFGDISLILAYQGFHLALFDSR